MSYRYDVFFSYKRDPQSDAWHQAVMEKLKYWLKQELGRTDVEIFFDTEEISAGSRWRNELTTALRASKTMVCLWSPLYFQSQWCVSEWKSFAARESQTGKDLIIPAHYYDGESFPAEARAKQAPDLSNYTSTSRRFWDTEDAYQFENRYLKKFARDIAARIRSAPDYDAGFPIVEVTTDQIRPLPPIGRPADA